MELIDRHVLSQSTILLNLAGDVNDVPGRLVVAIAFLVLKMVVLVAVVSAVAGVGQLHVGAPPSAAAAAAANGDQIDIAGPARRSVARVVRGKNSTKETTQHRHGAGHNTQVAFEDRQQDDVSNSVCRAKCQLCLSPRLFLIPER